MTNLHSSGEAIPKSLFSETKLSISVRALLAPDKISLHVIPSFRFLLPRQIRVKSKGQILKCAQKRYGHKERLQMNVKDVTWTPKIPFKDLDRSFPFSALKQRSFMLFSRDAANFSLFIRSFCYVQDGAPESRAPNICAMFLLDWLLIWHRGRIRGLRLWDQPRQPRGERCRNQVKNSIQRFSIAFF